MNFINYRLSANLISSHLILIFKNFNTILTLEIFISIIQSCVFSILLIFYFSESN